MQKSAISWTKETWNPVSGCSVVSDGCKHCYAATLSAKYGWTTKPWTLQNEEENVVIKPHKLGEPYNLKEPSKVFVNSMSDLFHRVIPDWYRAVVFCVMLDNPQHIFQVLTKRSEATMDWHERFVKAVASDEFREFAITLQNTPKVSNKSKVLNAMGRALRDEFASPWADHIWQGVSVEDARVLHRIDDLRECKAHVRFISAEPLLGAWGQVDLSHIHWVIVGGESGQHMTEGNPRWMKQEWAREIRDLCVAQGVAYFYKQDSGVRTEMRTYLVEDDGSRWKWEQYPGDLKPATNIDTGAEWEMPTKPYAAYDAPLPDYEWGSAPRQAFIKVTATPQPPPPAPSPDASKEQVAKSGQNLTDICQPTCVVNFQDVKAHWDKATQQWDDPQYVYIGRFNDHYRLPDSPWANRNPIEHDTPENRAKAIAKYREDIQFHLRVALDPQRFNLESLRGKTLVCWCSPKACHGDVLLELLGEKSAETPKAPEPEARPKQFSLFGEDFEKHASPVHY